MAVPKNRSSPEYSPCLSFTAFAVHFVNRRSDQAPQSNLGAGGAWSFLPLAFFSGIASLGSRGARSAGSLVGLTSEGVGVVVVVVERAMAAWLAVPRF